MVQRLKINQFYGAPTAIRLLLKYGDQWVQKYDRSTLKTLGSGTTNLTLTHQHLTVLVCMDNDSIFTLMSRRAVLSFILLVQTRHVFSFTLRLTRHTPFF